MLVGGLLNALPNSECDFGRAPAVADSYYSQSSAPPSLRDARPPTPAGPPLVHPYAASEGPGSPTRLANETNMSDAPGGGVMNGRILPALWVVAGVLAGASPAAALEYVLPEPVSTVVDSVTTGFCTEPWVQAFAEPAWWEASDGRHQPSWITVGAKGCAGSQSAGLIEWTAVGSLGVSYGYCASASGLGCASGSYVPTLGSGGCVVINARITSDYGPTDRAVYCWPGG